MKIFGNRGLSRIVMKNGSQVTGAAAACALILNAAMSYGAVPEAEAQKLNDSSRKENSMNGSATPHVPDVPRNVLQLKDADDLMGKYVKLADLTIDEFTPEAIEAIFGIKFGPRNDIGEGAFTARFDQSNPNQYPLELFYSKKRFPRLGSMEMRVRWPDYRPPICVDFLKLKAELERNGWVINEPSSPSRGGPARESFIRPEGNKKWYVSVDWTHGCVVNFDVRHEFAVGEQK